MVAVQPQSTTTLQSIHMTTNNLSLHQLKATVRSVTAVSIHQTR